MELRKVCGGGCAESKGKEGREEVQEERRRRSEERGALSFQNEDPPPQDGWEKPRQSKKVIEMIEDEVEQRDPVCAEPHDTMHNACVDAILELWKNPRVSEQGLLAQALGFEYERNGRRRRIGARVCLDKRGKKVVLLREFSARSNGSVQVRRATLRRRDRRDGYGPMPAGFVSVLDGHGLARSRSRSPRLEV